MFLTFKKWTILYILCLVLLFAGFAAILWQGSAAQASKNLVLREGKGAVLVIDPGHGGEDGGAVAADGTVESRINLAVALQIDEIAQLLGVETEMTRREDISIYSEDAETLRQKKVSDLKNRVEQINGVENGVLLSIHQNSMPTAPGVHGAQAFYNRVEGSEEMAFAVQEALNHALNGTENAKTAKRIGDDIYLMKNVTVPAVLVECGFLSNAQETMQLNTQEYQTKLAVTILSAALAHLQ
jgi:N-acetylmuramoyl-L-alanine amidase